MTNRSTLTLALTAGLLLAGCGGKTPAGGDNATAASDGSGATATTASADVSCPAAITTAPRTANAPVDDLIGIRPGLSYDEAANLVQCEDKTLEIAANSRGFDINSYGIKIRQGFDATPRKPQLSGQDIVKQMQEESRIRGEGGDPDRLKPGQQRFAVSTLGVPGQERVVGVWREQWFEEGRNPALVDVAGALVKKYGQPTLQENQSYYWLYDAMGRQLNRDSPNLPQCRGGVIPSDGSYSFNPDCGLTIVALLVPMPDNADLARTLYLGVADQAKGYAAIDATQQALQKMDAARRAGEVDRARQNADAPHL